MRIARFAEYASPDLGGFPSSEFLICKGLAELGHEVLLFTSTEAPTRCRLSNKTHVRVEKPLDNFTMIRVPGIITLGGDAPLMPSLILRTWNLNVDVIHAHEMYQPSTFAAFFVAKKNRASFTFTQDRYYMVHRVVWRLPFWLVNKTLCRHVCKAARLVTAFSGVARDFLTRQGYQKERIEVIPMGLDTTVYKPFNNNWFREFLGTADEPLILSVARLHPSKGIDVLLKAFSLVKNATPDAKLVIVGRGPWEEKAKEMLRRLKLEGSAFLVTQFLPDSAMPKVYNAADVFVLPSVYEPFGLAVVEAMACAVPVIVTDVGGLKDIVLHGVTGLKVVPNSVDILAKAITALLVNEDLRKSMGNKARRRVETKFDWRVVSKQYDVFYERLLEAS